MISVLQIIILCIICLFVMPTETQADNIKPRGKAYVSKKRKAMAHRHKVMQKKRMKYTLAKGCMRRK